MWWIYVILSGLVLLFLGLWIASEVTKTKSIDTDIKYGVVPNLDGILLTNCGPSQNQPCLFSTPTLAQAIAQCDILGNTCQQFVFVESSSTMRVVEKQGTFTSIGSDLYSVL
jgi:hypothetical protein